MFWFEIFLSSSFLLKETFIEKGLGLGLGLGLGCGPFTGGR